MTYQWLHLPESMLEPTIRIGLAKVDVQCDVRLVKIREVQINRVVHVTGQRNVVHGPHVVAETGMNRLPPAEPARGFSCRVWEMDGHHSVRKRSSHTNLTKSNEASMKSSGKARGVCFFKA